MIIQSVRKTERSHIPAGVLEVRYMTTVEDWALVKLPEAGLKTWIVCIHGHGASGDQLYTREDLRDLWLPVFQASGLGIFTPNLRGNAWMSPAARGDLQHSLRWLRSEYGAERFVFISGSMGGTSNLIYAAFHPEDVAGIVAYCPATDLQSYLAWCEAETDQLPVKLQIAKAIRASYGDDGEIALASAQKRMANLTMPIAITHGTDDLIIPVSQSRRFLRNMPPGSSFRYLELEGGDHDSPGSDVGAISWILGRATSEHSPRHQQPMSI